MYFGYCHIQHHTQTIHPKENFISMNLLQMSCVITWALSFLTFEVVEAVRGQKHVSVHTLALKLNVQFIPQCQFCLPKIHQETRSVMNFSLHISNSRTKAAGLDFYSLILVMSLKGGLHNFVKTHLLMNSKMRAW